VSKQKDTRLPEFLRPYFWDVEFENVDKETSKKFVIKRVLDRGNVREVRYVVDTYGKEAIKDVVLSTRDLARPTGNFWADILGLDKTQVPCLQKPYFPIHFGLFS
jgi:hypothetical protein